MRPAMSPAASSLCRALARRAAIAADRLLLVDWVSVDWQSLTFVGERHVAQLRVLGPNAAATVDRLLHDLDEAEFALPGHVLADIALTAAPEAADDGSVMISVEALTIAE
jgi:hypothetical protein